LIQKNAALHLEIADNGKGFPETPRPNQGIGLQIIKHRASVIGAKLETKSMAGKGVIVACTLPCGN
jgi:signal transduction histidine kinase